MLLIDKKHILLFTFFNLLFVLIMGIFGYASFHKYIVDDTIIIKIIAERFIFITVFSIIFLITFLIYFILKQRNIYKELDKLISITGYSNYNPTVFFSKFGKLGYRLNILNKELNNINNMKSLKISTLSKIIESLINACETACFIFDLRGEIIHINSIFLKQFKISVEQIKSIKTPDIFGLNISQILTKLTDVQRITERNMILTFNNKTTKSDIVLEPIYNADNNISAVVCYFSKT